jgi:hypothetical protein
MAKKHIKLTCKTEADGLTVGEEYFAILDDHKIRCGLVEVYNDEQVLRIYSIKLFEYKT